MEELIKPSESLLEGFIRAGYTRAVLRLITRKDGISTSGTYAVHFFKNLVDATAFRNEDNLKSDDFHVDTSFIKSIASGKASQEYFFATRL